MRRVPCVSKDDTDDTSVLTLQATEMAASAELATPALAQAASLDGRGGRCAALEAGDAGHKHESTVPEAPADGQRTATSRPKLQLGELILDDL